MEYETLKYDEQCDKRTGKSDIEFSPEPFKIMLKEFKPIYRNAPSLIKRKFKDLDLYDLSVKVKGRFDYVLIEIDGIFVVDDYQEADEITSKLETEIDNLITEMTE